VAGGFDSYLFRHIFLQVCVFKKFLFWLFFESYSRSYCSAQSNTLKKKHVAFLVTPGNSRSLRAFHTMLLRQDSAAKETGLPGESQHVRKKGNRKKTVVVCIINGILRKMKTDEQNTPLNELLICSICLTTDRLLGWGRVPCEYVR
jgi:hypothetical protein